MHVVDVIIRQKQLMTTRISDHVEVQVARTLGATRLVGFPTDHPLAEMQRTTVVLILMNMVMMVVMVAVLLMMMMHRWL